MRMQRRDGFEVRKRGVRAMASKGGQSRSTGNSGGSADTTETISSTGNTNPGHFANRPKEEVKKITSTAGKVSSCSFDPGSKRAREAGRQGGREAGGIGFLI
jgi:general stress protein YciG